MKIFPYLTQLHSCPFRLERTYSVSKPKQLYVLPRPYYNHQKLHQNLQIKHTGFLFFVETEKHIYCFSRIIFEIKICFNTFLAVCIYMSYMHVHFGKLKWIFQDARILQYLKSRVFLLVCNLTCCDVRQSDVEACYMKHGKRQNTEGHEKRVDGQKDQHMYT